MATLSACVYLLSSFLFQIQTVVCSTAREWIVSLRTKDMTKRLASLSEPSFMNTTSFIRLTTNPSLFHLQSVQILYLWNKSKAYFPSLIHLQHAWMTSPVSLLLVPLSSIRQQVLMGQWWKWRDFSTVVCFSSLQSHLGSGVSWSHSSYRNTTSSRLFMGLHQLISHSNGDQPTISSVWLVTSH